MNRLPVIAGLAIVALASACSPQETVDGRQTSTQETIADPGEQGATSTGTSAATGDGAATGPTGAALPPGVPDTYWHDMADLAQGTHLEDPPEVFPIRAVGLTEYPKVMATCLTDMGFPSVVSEDGKSWEGEFTQNQAPAHSEATYVCIGRYPLAEAYTKQFSREQLRVVYDWDINEVIPCMKKLGYPTPEPPTFESFTATYDQGGGLWFPDGTIDEAILGEAMGVIMKSCEVEPPNEKLYGPGS